MESTARQQHDQAGGIAALIAHADTLIAEGIALQRDLRDRCRHLAADPANAREIRELIVAAIRLGWLAAGTETLAAAAWCADEVPAAPPLPPGGVLRLLPAR